MNNKTQSSTMKWFRVLKNKYFITSLSFVVLMLFFDANNILQLTQLQRRKLELIKDKNYFIKEVELAAEQLKQIDSDNFAMETFAREVYFMKKPGEDVYVFVPPLED
jgi:cell division protein DivIC